jgi:hypothetical protein
MHSTSKYDTYPITLQAYIRILIRMSVYIITHIRGNALHSITTDRSPSSLTVVYATEYTAARSS